MKLELEGNRVEYKKARNSLPADFWKTYSAFANTSGGKVILGVEEIDGDLRISGVQKPENIKKELFDLLHSDKISENLITNEDVLTESNDQKIIIIINIREANDRKKPVYLHNNLKQCYKRGHEGNYRCTDEEIQYMIRNRYEELDNDLLEGYSIDDFDSSTVQEYCAKLTDGTADDFFDKDKIQEILLSIGALREDRKTKKKLPTLGGLLFFGKYQSIREQIPHFHLEYYNYINLKENRWNDRVASGDRDYPNLNLYQFYKITFEKLKLTVAQEFDLDDDYSRKDTSDIHTALRELLVNSIMHADYREEKPIKVAAYNDYYEFSNPGLMKVSLRDYEIGGLSRPRNHIIEQLFRKVGLSERAGSGGRKVFTVANKRDYLRPRISQQNLQTDIKFWNVDIIAKNPDLTELQKNILIFIKRNGMVTSRQVQEDQALSKREALDELSGLMDRDLVERIGKSVATRYRIKMEDATSQFIADMESFLETIKRQHREDKDY